MDGGVLSFQGLMKLHSTGKDVQEIQNALVLLDCLSPDDATGEWDVHSREALREFQRASKLKITGEPDEATRKMLNQRLRAKG